MKKGKIKLLIISLIAFTFLVLPTYARKVTSLEELGKLIEEKQKGAYSAYIVGDYVFTNKYNYGAIGLQDVGLAFSSTSIKPENPKDKNSINIYTIENTTKWVIRDNLVGTKELTITEEKPLNVRFIDYEDIPEVSKANLQFNISDNSYKNALNNSYGVGDVNKLYDGTLSYNEKTNKLTGLMLKHDIDSKAGFTGDDRTNYYLPFVIEVPELQKSTTVKIKNDKEITARYANFDIQTKNEGKTPGILVLLSINSKTDESHSQIITIEVDLDGDDGAEYEPTKYTIDYSDLKFQEESSINNIGSHTATDGDNQIMEGWGYDSTRNKKVEIKPVDGTNTFNLSGTLVEQSLSSPTAFGATKKEGYYFDFTFVIPDNIDKTKVEISQVTDSTGQTEKKKYVRSEYDDNNNLTILFRFSPETTTCTDANNCKIYFKVDLDGAGNEYLPVVYTLDYKDNLIFEKYSKVNVLDLDTVSNFEEASWKGWEKGADYTTTTTVDQNDPYTVKVTGFIPIFDDNSWSDGNPFINANDYYLGFKIQKSGLSGSTSTTVKFLNDKVDTAEEGDGENNTITQSDFGDNNEIYVLKHVNPLKSETSKKFTITVDFDDEGETYAPYTVTIDWSGLEFQKESGRTEITTIDSEEEGNGILETDKTKLEKEWGYSLKNAGAVSVTDDYKLIGKVKEQTLKSAAGFSNDKGYYVAFKIQGPSKEKYPDTVNKWTVQLKDETGKYMEAAKPSDEDYQNGFIVALIKLKDQGDSKVFNYKIDFDGSEKNYLPYEETIDYSGLTFLTSHTITFDDKKAETQNKVITLWDGDKIVEPSDFVPKADDTYHEFAYWNKEDGTKFDTIELNKDSGNIDLVPHWNLYSDKFIADVLEDLNSTNTEHSQNFRDKFEIEYVKNSGQVTINVLDPTTTLSEMNNTSIPGAIAYILLKNEIPEISLSIGSEGTAKKVFEKNDISEQEALKSAIINSAKEVYSEIKEQFESKEDTAVTLSEIAHKVGYESFTLKVEPEKIAKTVTLVKEADAAGSDVPTSYEFTFKSDSVVVDSEENLKRVLGETAANTIFISQGFNVTQTIDISRNVTINGENHKLTATSDQPIFNIKSGNVTLDVIELSDNNTTAVVVEGGSLTSTGMKITGENLEAGIEVKAGASLNANEIQYDNEHYTRPLVRTAKSGASVTLIDSTGKQAVAMTEKENITVNIKDNNGNDLKTKDNDYNYNNYYNKPENSRIYRTEIYNYLAGGRYKVEKYNYYNEPLTAPSEVSQFSKFSYDGQDYELIGFSESSGSVLSSSDDVPEGAIKNGELKVTEDGKHYWAVFKVTLKAGAARVDNEALFKNIIENLSTNNITAIYVTKELTIDYSDQESFKIDAENLERLAIFGPPSSTGKVTIKAKKVVIGDKLKDVNINRINFEIASQDGQESLIEVNGEKLTLWQSGLTNTGSKVDYAIKYTNAKSIVDVRYMGIDSTGFVPNNIGKAYIYVSGNLAAGSDLYFNTFAKENDEDKKSAIIIKGFAADAVVTEEDDGEPDIRFESNTVTTPYGIKFEKEVSGQKGDIKLGSATIGIEWDNTHTDFEGIGLYAKPEKVNIKYINAGDETEQKPNEVKMPTFKPKSAVLPESATISGLTQNEDGKYSGIINQSSDGNFYLPVTLSSNQFDDRVSKVTVTDPNGDKKEYLYYVAGDNGFAQIMNIDSANIMSTEVSKTPGTMTLNLEAIKASRITGENGKLYKIDIDYNGDNQVDTNYEIDYNSVDTLEEVINKAADNTQAATSLTVTKNNRIKGLDEDFTFKYARTEDRDVTLYSENGVDKEYTFRYNKVVTDHNGPIIIAVRKPISEDGRPVIGNDWEFANFFKEVSKGYHEISLLQDVMKQTKTINAISKVVEVDSAANKFEVTLNKDKLNDWLDNAYLSSTYFDKNQQPENKQVEGTTDNENVVVEVVLDETHNYIVSINTKHDFSVKSSDNHEYTDNRIDVQFSGVNGTNIEAPLEFLAEEGSELTVEDIIKFYEACKKWHHDTTGADIYEG